MHAGTRDHEGHGGKYVYIYRYHINQTEGWFPQFIRTHLLLFGKQAEAQARAAATLSES